MSIYRTLENEIRPETTEFVRVYNLLDTNPKQAISKLTEFGWSVDCWELKDGEWKREDI